MKTDMSAKLSIRPIIEINNTSKLYIAKCVEILDAMGIESYSVYCRRPSSSATKDVHILNIRGLEQVTKLLSVLAPYLIVKKNFACAIIGLFGSHDKGSRWSEKEIAAAIAVRTVYMPRSTHGNGEVETDFEDALNLVAQIQALGLDMLSVIPSEVLGSVSSTRKPLESRATSSTSSNSPHECPASYQDEDVLRSSRKLESRDKELGEDIGIN
jgi:hypothetical protein